MKIVRKKKIKIIKSCVIFALAIVLGWIIPAAMTSLEISKYYKHIDVVSSNELYVGRFSVDDGVDASDFTDILDSTSYVEGYFNANTTTTVKTRSGKKTIGSTLIFKTGKWSNRNTYKIVEGNDLPDTFDYTPDSTDNRVPVLVSENQWKKHAVGDNIDLDIPTASGNVETVAAYIAGKISNYTPIVGVNFYFTEPYAGEIIIPDIGVERYIKNSTRSYAVMLKIGEGTMISLIADVIGIAHPQVSNERRINYSVVEEQQSKTEYMIYIAVVLSVALAAAAFLIDKDLRFINCLIAAITMVIFVIIYTASQFAKDVFYKLDTISIFTQNAALYLQSAIVPDIIYLTAANVILYSALIITSFILKKKQKTIIKKIEPAEKLYD